MLPWNSLIIFVTCYCRISYGHWQCWNKEHRNIWESWDWAPGSRTVGVCLAEWWLLLPSKAPPCRISLPVTPFNTCLHHWCGNSSLRMKVSVSMHFLSIFSYLSSSTYYPLGRPFAYHPECELLVPMSFIPISSSMWIVYFYGYRYLFSCSSGLWLLSCLAFTVSTCALKVLLVWFSNHCFFQIYVWFFSRSQILADSVTSFDLHSI